MDFPVVLKIASDKILHKSDIGGVKVGETTAIAEGATQSNTIIEYTITYNGLTNGEKESLHNPTTYTVEDEITLNNPENRYDQDHDLSEVFVGWTGSNGDDPSTEVKIVKGTTGNKEYTAKEILQDFLNNIWKRRLLIFLKVWLGDWSY